MASAAEQAPRIGDQPRGSLRSSAARRSSSSCSPACSPCCSRTRSRTCSNGSSGNSSPRRPPPRPHRLRSPHGRPRETRLAGAGTGADPFAAKSLPNGDAHAAAAGGPDPFTQSSASSSTSVASRPAAIPNQIVIGRPGGHRVAKRSWIVILASIPTANGRRAALQLRARSAPERRRGSRSSTRRIAARCAAATGSSTRGRTRRCGGLATRGDVHAAGYRTAYIRELITYR